MAGFLQRLRSVWTDDLGHDERAAIVAWSAFTATFGGVRVLTHWIHRGHGPAAGGMVLGGRHLHHYNIGIAMLAGIGGLAVRSEASSRVLRSPALPMAYGAANALIADEAALLLDLQDVYWLPQGRQSVHLAVGTIGVGGLGLALVPLLKHFQESAPRGA